MSRTSSFTKGPPTPALGWRPGPPIGRDLLVFEENAIGPVHQCRTSYSLYSTSLRLVPPCMRRLQNIQISGSEFLANAAEISAGALYANSMAFSVVVLDTTFELNVATGARHGLSFSHNRVLPFAGV